MRLHARGDDVYETPLYKMFRKMFITQGTLGIEHVLSLKKNRISSLKMHQTHLYRFFKIPDLLNQGFWLWDPNTFQMLL